LLWFAAAGAAALCVALAVPLFRGGDDEAAADAPELPPVRPAEPAREAPPPRSYVAIAEHPAFGESAERSARPAQVEVPLNVTVVGTIVQGSRSLAIVETGSGEQKLVRAGESLEGARVISVSRGTVVLDYGGRRVELPVTPSRRARPAAPAVPPRSVAISTPEPAAPAAEAELADIDLEDFDAFIEGLKANINDVAGSPAHDAGGRPFGLVLDRIPEDSILRRMGIQPGDVVTEVNMMPISDMESLIEAFDEVARDVLNEDELFIVIEMVREQKPDTIILSIW
jgi:type II secretory pathway component PulC